MYVIEGGVVVVERGGGDEFTTDESLVEAGASASPLAFFLNAEFAEG